jgi:3-hydroxyisobutyrate dehydrogenase-like beta-hydroxyacid dehydrogenase
MKVAFLGIGLMGAPMAANLARRGHAVKLWNRTRARLDAALQQYPSLADPRVGAAVCTTIAEAVRDAEIVISILADPPAIAAVMEGPDGALAHMPAGSLLIEMSTVDPATQRRLHELAKARGIGFIDAPVIGSVKPAEEGTLLVMAGGAAEDVERARPALEAMGRLKHVGPVGAGASLKLVANSLGAHMITGFGAVLVLAKKLGLDPALVVDTIVGSAFTSPVYAHRGPKILDGDFRPDFSLRLAEKDWRLALETAASVGYEMPTLAACREVLLRAIEAGLGDEDMGGLIRVFEAQAGVAARREKP